MLLYIYRLPIYHKLGFSTATAHHLDMVKGVVQHELKFIAARLEQLQHVILAIYSYQYRVVSKAVDKLCVQKMGKVAYFKLHYGFPPNCSGAKLLRLGLLLPLDAVLSEDMFPP